jgi:hypothetical protein
MALRDIADDGRGVDLQPDSANGATELRRLMFGHAKRFERYGLAK